MTYLLHFLDKLVVEGTTDQALDGIESVGGVSDGLALGSLTDEALAVLGEGDDGGSGAGTFSVFDHTGSLTLHDGNARVGGSEIDTDDVPDILGSGETRGLEGSDCGSRELVSAENAEWIRGCKSMA
jgi:hypothetical protein